MLSRLGIPPEVRPRRDQLAVNEQVKTTFLTSQRGHNVDDAANSGTAVNDLFPSNSITPKPEVTANGLSARHVTQSRRAKRIAILMELYERLKAEQRRRDQLKKGVALNASPINSQTATG